MGVKAWHDMGCITISLKTSHHKNLPDIVICKRGVKNFEISVVDVLEDEGWCFGLTVAHDVEKSNDVGPPAQILQTLDFSLDFLQLELALCEKSLRCQARKKFE